MQTFESGGALMVNPRAPVKTLVSAIGFGAAILAIPPIVGVYLLLVA